MNFVNNICKCNKHWNMKDFKNEIIDLVRKKLEIIMFYAAYQEVLTLPLLQCWFTKLLEIN